MKLKRVHVQNFRSVINSGDSLSIRLHVSSERTKAGKSAILDALYKMNPVEPEERLDALAQTFPEYLR